MVYMFIKEQTNRQRKISLNLINYVYNIIYKKNTRWNYIS